MGMVAALGDHKGVDGHGQPSDDAKEAILREQNRPDVIDGHGEHGDELQLIAGKREPGADGVHEGHLLLWEYYTIAQPARQSDTGGAPVRMYTAKTPSSPFTQQLQYPPLPLAPPSRRPRQRKMVRSTAAG